MADVQQWRRKIPTGRATAKEPDDPDELLSPTTPKRRPNLKLLLPPFGPTPKLSTTEDFPGLHTPSPSAEDANPCQAPEAAMDSVLHTLMSGARVKLDERFNGMLLRILESYRHLRDEKDLLQQKLDDEIASREAAFRDLKRSEKAWQSEKQDYVDEVKRLEVILAKASSRGVAEVTLARQNSKIYRRKVDRQDKKETIFEFLEKTKRYEDRAWSSQRATMKMIPGSSIAREAILSKTLKQKKSMTSIHADLPFGTPPPSSRFSLTAATMLESQENATDIKWADNMCRSEASASEDTFSDFSYEDRIHRTGTEKTSATIVPGPEDELDAIKRAADVLARRRNMNPTVTISQVLGLFSDSTTRAGDGDKGINLRGNQTPISMVTSSRKIGQAPATMTTRHTVMEKASGFFQKLKSQSNIEGPSANVRSLSRRFSFEPGDDGAAQAATLAVTGPTVCKSRFLRKSVSLSSLAETMQHSNALPPSLSPLPQSPTASATHMEARMPSRIPTPRYSSSSFARPRRDRDESSSSLVTTIMRPDGTQGGRSSRGSSVYSSRSMSRDSFNGKLHTTASQSTGSAGLKPSSSRTGPGNATAPQGDAADQATTKTATVSSCRDASDMDRDSQGDQKRTIGGHRNNEISDGSSNEGAGPENTRPS